MSKKNIDLSSINAVIWDFDGVFFDFRKIPAKKWSSISLDANAQAACTVLPGLKHNDAINLTLSSSIKNGDGFADFVPLAKKRGMSEAELIRKMNSEYHKILLKTVLTQFPETLDLAKGTVSAFNKLGSNTRHIVLTHSCAQSWTEPVIKKIGLSQIFNKHSILDYEKFDFVHKGKSPRPVEKALKTLSCRANNAIFVEDNPKHLQIAKTAFSKITTVLISSTYSTPPDQVDIVVKNPHELLQLLIRAKPLKSFP